MNYQYVVYGDGKVWEYKLTREGAKKVVRFLTEKGIRADYSSIKGDLK